jgi:benzoyl-CoA reductase/2-hydroxyglutaryl-CoA dehydratase subunit BcrC/BadD/HgdB
MSIQPNALERMVAAFQMGSAIPEDLDFESPDVKLLLDSLPERRRAMFVTMAKDPDVRMISNVFNRGMGNYWESVLTAKDQGKKVVFIPFNFSPEIFYALDMVPVGVEVLDTMTMTLEEGIAPYLDLSIERGLPETMCSAQRAVVGMLEAGVLGKPDLLVNGALGGCDPNTKIFEYMGEKFDIPTLFIDVPYYHDKRSFKYYEQGFKEVVKILEEVSGNKLDEDRLREVCSLSNKANELAMEISDLKRHVPNPVPNYYNMNHLATKLSKLGTQDAVDFYQIAYDRSLDRFKKGKHVLPEERLRFMFMYTGIYFDNSFHAWFQEEKGISYIMDMLIFSDHVPYIDTRNTDTMLAGLAAINMNLPMTRQLKGSNNFHGGWISDLLYYVEKYKADCVVFTGHTACKQVWGIYRMVADRIQKELGTPTLRMEADGWDSRTTSLEVLKEQWEEFFETIPKYHGEN